MDGSDRVGVRQIGRDTCYFCGSEGPIERHHIVPRRYDGPDEESNLVDLCPTCHERLERLYDDETWGLVEADASDDHSLDRDVGTQLVGVITTHIQDVEEQVYPTREEIETGLQINGARDDQLRYHITNAQDDGVIVTAGEVSVNGDSDDEYFYATGRKVPQLTPWTDLNVPTEFCEYCEDEILVLETSDDGEPKCFECGLTRTQRRQVVTGEVSYRAIKTSQEDEGRLIECVKRVIKSVDQSNPDAPGAPQDEARNLACELLDITEDQFDEWLEQQLSRSCAEFHPPEYVSINASVTTYGLEEEYYGEVDNVEVCTDGIKDVINTVDECYPNDPGAPREEVIMASMLLLGLSIEAIEGEIDQLKIRGDIYLPDADHIKAV